MYKEGEKGIKVTAVFEIVLIISLSFSLAFILSDYIGFASAGNVATVGVAGAGLAGVVGVGLVAGADIVAAGVAAEAVIAATGIVQGSVIGQTILAEITTAGLASTTAAGYTEAVGLILADANVAGPIATLGTNAAGPAYTTSGLGAGLPWGNIFGMLARGLIFAAVGFLVGQLLGSVLDLEGGDPAAPPIPPAPESHDPKLVSTTS